MRQRQKCNRSNTKEFPGPNVFLAEFYHKAGREGMLPNSFYHEKITKITLIPNQIRTHNNNKEKISPNEYKIFKNSQWKVCKLNSTTHLKYDPPPQSSCSPSWDVQIAQHMKIQRGNTAAHKQTQRQKSHDHPSQLMYKRSLTKLNILSW